MEGSVKAIGRDLRAGQILCSTRSAARMSPPFAAPTIALRMSSPASSAILSSSNVALLREPAGRPGPPGWPGSKGRPGAFRLFDAFLDASAVIGAARSTPTAGLKTANKLNLGGLRQNAA